MLPAANADRELVSDVAYQLVIKQILDVLDNRAR